MARSIATIQQQIINSVQGNTTLYNPYSADPSQKGLTSTSQVAWWLAWTYIVAVGMNLLEQVIDVFTANIETQIESAAPSTPSWLVNQVKQFQYSDSNPQIPQINSDFSISWPVVNPALQVINQVAIITSLQGQYIIKVAKNGLPVTANQFAALQAYLEVINPAGISAVIISQTADYFMCGATIYYDATYSGIIQASITQTITNYLANLNFNGNVVLSDLMIAIKSTAGVKDAEFTQVELQGSGSGDNLIQMIEPSPGNPEWLAISAGTISGNAVPDTRSGRRLSDTLTYIPQ
jgi:hypothetical protein